MYDHIIGELWRNDSKPARSATIGALSVGDSYLQ